MVNIKRVGSNSFGFLKKQVNERRFSKRNANYAENFRKAYSIKKTMQEKLNEERLKKIGKYQEKHRIIGTLLKLREKRKQKLSSVKALPIHGSKKRRFRYFI